MFNAASLKDQFEQIAHLYNTKSLIVIAHGKGGIDTECAILLHNAEYYIDRVITLGTPYWGSPVADNLYYKNSSLKIPGTHKSDAEFDLQTSRMLSFRKAYDASLKKVPFFALAGSKTSFYTERSVNYFLNNLGTNDGVVLLKSTIRPSCINIGVLPLDHYRLMDGESIWNTLEPYLFSKHSSYYPMVSSNYNGSISIYDVISSAERAIRQIHDIELTYDFFKVLLFISIVLYLVFIHSRHPIV